MTFKIAIITAIMVAFYSHGVFASQSGTIELPGFILKPPKGHFAGVSIPSISIADARKSAIDDVRIQVLRAVGSEYEHQYNDRINGNVNKPKRIIDDRLVIRSSALILGIEQNIIKSKWDRNDSGKYVFFILVRYPKRLIEKMRRLSIGAKVFASLTDTFNGKIGFKLTEVNGVSVVFSSAKIKISKKNRFSKAISFFVWSVSEGFTTERSITFQPIRLRSNFETVRVPIGGIDKNVKDYLLCAEIKRSVIFHGFDEIGRPVSAATEF